MGRLVPGLAFYDNDLGRDSIVKDDPIPVSEIFASVQGEGPDSGKPAIFLRFAFCNLKCVWCDSDYTWKGKVIADWRTPEWVAEKIKNMWSPRGQFRVRSETLPPTSFPVRIPTRAGPPHLVVTGGEPLLFQDGLESLLNRLTDWYVEVETNGTIAPTPELTRLVSQFNVSPKLANSGMELNERRVEPALSAFLNSKKAWWKFVVCSEDDITEILQWVNDFALPPDRIILMPEGKTREAVLALAPGVARLASRHGFKFSHRLHILIWNGERAR
ncbi:MAG: 7-carboxy-7-deazaguanine synthase QueE [bacterium JZ-2024 1]